jgi:hypothetical protein
MGSSLFAVDVGGDFNTSIDRFQHQHRTARIDHGPVAPIAPWLRADLEGVAGGKKTKPNPAKLSGFPKRRERGQRAKLFHSRRHEGAFRNIPAWVLSWKAPPSHGATKSGHSITMMKPLSLKGISIRSCKSAMISAMVKDSSTTIRRAAA